MRTKTFSVPQEMIFRFFGFLDKTMLQVKLAEIDENQELLIEIGYTEDDKEAMMDLIELYDQLLIEEESEEVEEDTEEEEDEDDMGCLEQEEEEAEVKPKRRTNRKKIKSQV